MKHIIIIGLLVLAFAAYGQSEKEGTKKKREYSSRIELHKVDFGLGNPTEEPEEPGSADEKKFDALPARRSSPAETLSPDYLYMQDAEAEKKEKRKKNWILPPMSEDLKKYSPRDSNEEKDKDEESGWGWLADDIRARRERQQAESKGEGDGNEEGTHSAAERPRERESGDELITPLFGAVIESDGTLKPVDTAPESAAGQSMGSSRVTEEDVKELERRLQEGDYDNVASRADHSAGSSGEGSVWAADTKESEYLPRTGALLSHSGISGDDSSSFIPKTFDPDATASRDVGVNIHLSPTPAFIRGSADSSAGYSGSFGKGGGKSAFSSPFSSTPDVSGGGSLGGLGTFSTIGSGGSASSGAMKPLEPFKPIQPSQPFQDVWKMP
ncbi:MAG: hypothetical protein KJ626_01320 [Verrucomicrobia bacterium]|nr:hypothetical protein [Verrucomicrobiota bacterium]